jgi:hypothetical protein
MLCRRLDTGGALYTSVEVPRGGAQAAISIIALMSCISIGTIWLVLSYKGPVWLFRYYYLRVKDLRLVS